MNQCIDGLVHLPRCCQLEFDSAAVSLLPKQPKKIGEPRVQQRFTASVHRAAMEKSVE
jgi:hypothetical protein